jgi:hypothetical protein
MKKFKFRSVPDFMSEYSTIVTFFPIFPISQWIFLGNRDSEKHKKFREISGNISRMEILMDVDFSYTKCSTYNYHCRISELV